MGVAYERAQVLYRQERYAQAQKEFERELAEQPNHAHSVAMVAMCLTGQNLFVLARTTAEQAIALDPEDDLGHYSLAWALYKDAKYTSRRGVTFATDRNDLNKRRLKEVDRALREALRLQSRNAGYHSLLAFTRLELGDARGALDSANACLAINPHHSDGHRAAAWALSRMGDQKQAQAASASAVSAQPLGFETHLTRAHMLLRQSKYGEAMNHFREAVRLSPSAIPPQRGLLDCLRRRFWFYRWRARLNYVPRTLMVIYCASLVLIVGSVSDHFGSEPPIHSWDPILLAVLCAGVALFIWLCFSKNAADLLLLSDPLARRMLPALRRRISWLNCLCVTAIVVIGAVAVALTAAGRNIDALYSAGEAIFILAWGANVVLFNSEKGALRGK
jgi:tetratricopeptide (TPR) repeat protein